MTKESIQVALKVKREGVGLTQIETARNLGVSNSTISMWETGESLPRTELLPKLAALYNCTIDELLGKTKGG